MRLVCLPYAGGSAMFHMRWRRLVPAWIDVRPIEWPAHGAVHVFGAPVDETCREALRAWMRKAAASFRLDVLPGRHFFIHTQQSEPVDLIGAALARQSGLSVGLHRSGHHERILRPATH